MSFAGEYCFMMPAEPLAHSTPLLTGWLGVALDEADAAVLDRHLDAATARAHVAGAVVDLLTGTVVENDFAGHVRLPRCAAQVRRGEVIQMI